MYVFVLLLFSAIGFGLWRAHNNIKKLTPATGSTSPTGGLLLKKFGIAVLPILKWAWRLKFIVMAFVTALYFWRRGGNLSTQLEFFRFVKGSQMKALGEALYIPAHVAGVVLSIVVGAWLTWYFWPGRVKTPKASGTAVSAHKEISKYVTLPIAIGLLAIVVIGTAKILLELFGDRSVWIGIAFWVAVLVFFISAMIKAEKTPMQLLCGSVVVLVIIIVMQVPVLKTAGFVERETEIRLNLALAEYGNNASADVNAGVSGFAQGVKSAANYYQEHPQSTTVYKQERVSSCEAIVRTMVDRADREVSLENTEDFTSENWCELLCMLGHEIEQRQTVDYPVFQDPAVIQRLGVYFVQYSDLAPFFTTTKYLSDCEE